jgi:signal transduction histidine kinase
MVSGIAHELNNPLAGILAFSQLLLNSDPDEPELRDGLRTIHREAERAAKIVGNLLRFARQRATERALTDVSQALLDTLELRRYALRTHQIDLVTAVDLSLPPIWADRFQLEQVFLNLLTNAEHALKGHEGAKRLSVATRRDGDVLVVTVADTGPGIPPELMPHLLEPFFTTKPVGVGTGLGLSISDGIVREHGGRMRVESAPGAGATFHVELPITAPPGQPDGHLPRQPLRADAPPDTSAAGDPTAASSTADG